MVESISSDEHVIFVLVVKLLQNLSNGTSSQFWVASPVLCTLDNVHNLLGLGTFLSKSVGEDLESVVMLLGLVVVDELLPVVTPALALLIVDTRVGFTVLVFGARDVVVSVETHINVHLTENLLV